MARKDESIINLLIAAPWWVSVIFSAVIYFSLGIVLPSLTMESAVFSGLQSGLTNFAHWIALFFLIPAPLSYFNTARKRKLLDNQRGIDSIRNLDWKAFEELVGEAYRRQGYQVIENSSGGADGGVDLRLIKGGKTTLVQCKQWRSQSVGVKTVREMYGVMVAERAVEVIIVCTGSFTHDANRFAEGKPIKLVTGNQLESLVASVQSTPKEHLVIQQAVMDTAKPELCPRCSSKLVLRKAKRGANAGNEFYGCETFPKCRYTKAL